MSESRGGLQASLGVLLRVPVTVNKKSVSLHRLANSLLRNNDNPLQMTKAPSGLSVAVSENQFQKRRKVEKISAAYYANQHTYRHLPKPIRKAITDRFKAERDAGSKTDWNDWLTRQLEILDGLQVQRTTAGDRQDRPIDPEGRRPSRRL